MNPRLKTVGGILLFAFAYLLLYTLLHEGAHALVILAYGGTIDSFVLGLNAHVSSHGGEFTVFGEALNYAAGMLLPTVLGAVALFFYNPKLKPIAYHACYFLASISLISSILFVWATFPILSYFSPLPQGEDVTRFLDATRLPPLLVSLGALALAALFVLLMYKKGLLKKAKGTLEAFKKIDKIGLKRRLIVAVSVFAAALIVAIFVLSPEPAVFNASFVWEDALEEKERAFTFDVEEQRSYAVDLEMEAQGFITALQILDENDEQVYQNLGEAFSFTMRIELSKGKHTLLLTHLKDYEAVEQFLESTGQQKMKEEDRPYIVEVFSHAKNDPSAAFSIEIR